jgi:hypothetical protein
MYLIIHQESGLACENFVPKAQITKTIQYWEEFGMKGTYKAVYQK